jgi:hypothetical protein
MLQVRVLADEPDREDAVAEHERQVNKANHISVRIDHG